jgi:hypothetical protein
MTGSAKGTVESERKGVRQKVGLNMETPEASPSMMISMLRDRAARAGGWFAVIDTPECAECARTVLKDLVVRIL